MSSPLDVLESMTLQADADEHVVEMSQTGVDVSLTGPGIGVALAVAIGCYMLGKLAQIWLKDKLKSKSKDRDKTRDE